LGNLAEEAAAALGQLAEDPDSARAILQPPGDVASTLLAAAAQVGEEEPHLLVLVISSVLTLFYVC
jgi:hypothetical protein